MASTQPELVGAAPALTDIKMIGQRAAWLQSAGTAGIIGRESLQLLRLGSPRPMQTSPVVSRLRSAVLHTADLLANEAASAALARRGLAAVQASRAHASSQTSDAAARELETILDTFERLVRSASGRPPLLQVLQRSRVAARLVALDKSLTELAERQSLDVPWPGAVAEAAALDASRFADLVSRILGSPVSLADVGSHRIDTMFEIALSRDDALGVLDEHLRERFNALLSGVSEHLAAETGHRLVQVPRISIPSDGVDIHFDRPIESHCLFGECFAGMLSGEVVDVEFPCGIDTADAVVSFGRSMSRVSRQTHPSLLRPLRVCLNSDRPFVVTQPARRSVSSMLEGSSPLSIVDRVRVVLAIASLLNSLHSLHPPIVHGGLSAECVVVDDAGNAKIAHTAMATIAGGSASGVRRRLQGIRWPAPELLDANQPLSPAMDVFAFGLTALHLISGREPFSEFGSSNVAAPALISRWTLNGQEPFWPDTVPGTLVPWLHMCCAADPASRPPLVDVIQYLDAFVKASQTAPSQLAIFYQESQHTSSRDTRKPDDIQAVLDLFPSLKNDRRINYQSLSRMPELVNFNQANRISMLHLLSMGIKGEIPQDIGRLNHLVTLTLSRNHLVGMVPKEIGSLKLLRILNLAGNILTTLHPEIGRLKLLTELRLGSNRLTSLPSTIGDLAQLETLDCSSNLIKSFPEKICNLVRLKTLKLCNNQIQSIPYNLGRLTRLKLLAIQNNKIMELPDSLSNLVELEELYINNNSGPFQKLPDLTPLKYLRVFRLDHSRMSKIPSWIGEMTSLHNLNIAHNPITSLPDSFTRLVNLEYLRFEKNDPVIPKQVRWAFYAKL
ncbi:hypothetical protein HK105_202601 [Polyrhizophydium stewartii]|uniref:Protein kinase domain-containing protein n=1 Tax=Polyrhizophydium stewartii TaxID=2732419 RepID=A0ABR4NDW9_9FUNG